jgi:predicted PurR-regulated permease PerM
MALTSQDEATIESTSTAEDDRARREAQRLYSNDDRIPLPEDLRTALLAGILMLMVFYTLYFAREIVMPILFAFLLNLLLQPAMRFLDRLRIPKVISAVLVILLLFGSFTIIFSSLAAPAADWFGKLPQTFSRIEDKLYLLRAPLKHLQQANEELNKLTAPQGGNATPVVVQDSGLGGILFSNTQAVLTGLLTTVVVLFFLLVTGDLFLRKLVEVLPRFRDKKQAVAMSQEIEQNVSAYLATISVMNLLVGVAVGLAAYVTGLGDPVLWGAVAFLLNYIPIIGPLIGVVLLFLAGMLVFDTVWQAVLVAGIYLGIHFLEGEVVTPMLVARRFILNPVLVVISLIFWYWMWGVPGAIISVPLLATVKIICDNVRPLMALGHFIGG